MTSFHGNGDAGFWLEYTCPTASVFDYGRGGDTGRFIYPACCANVCESGFARLSRKLFWRGISVISAFSFRIIVGNAFLLPIYW